ISSSSLAVPTWSESPVTASSPTNKDKRTSAEMVQYCTRYGQRFVTRAEGAEMATRDIIVIGASAGGVDALMRLCSALPKDLPASIFVAQHLSPSSRSLLPALLDRSGPLPVVAPVDCQAFEQGHVYVAPPDHHLLVRDDHILVRRGP